jgi:hypothetical protein
LGIGIVALAALTVVVAAKRKRWSFVFLLLPALSGIQKVVGHGMTPMNAPGAYLCIVAGLVGVIGVCKLPKPA